MSVVSPTADLALTMAGSPNPVVLGTNVTYTLTVSNGGPATAAAVAITNTLPPNVRFVSASAGYTTNGSTVIFTNLGNLLFSAQTSVYIVVRPLAAGTITNTAVVSSSVADLFKANNSASIKIDVQLAQMTIARAGNTIVISWPSGASGYTLESTTNLQPPVAWSAVNTGGQNTITLGTTTNASRFFRLRTPAP